MPSAPEPQNLLVGVGGLGPARCEVGPDGALSLTGLVRASSADSAPVSDWLIGAACGRLYRVQDKSVLPPFGGGAGATSNAVTNGGDVSLNGRFALAYSYGTGECAVLTLSWHGAADGDVTGWVDGSLRSHTERCTYDPALADRQDQSHLHQAKLHPISNRWAFFPDLGCDKVWVYQFDPILGTLSAEPTALDLPHGSGPRHCDFHPSGEFLYITCELDANVVVASCDDSTGKLTILQTISALPEGAVPNRGPNMGNAHIRCSADGRNVYTSTRSDDSLTAFAATAGGAQLEYLQHIPSGGECPVHFGLDPNHKFLWCANARSSNVVCFEIAAGEGEDAGSGGGGTLTQRATLTLPAEHGPGYVSSPKPQLTLQPITEAAAAAAAAKM